MQFLSFVAEGQKDHVTYKILEQRIREHVLTFNQKVQRDKQVCKVSQPMLSLVFVLSLDRV